MNQDQAPEWWFVSARGLHHALGCRCGLGDQLGDGLLQSFVICQSWRNELFRIMDRSKATYLCIHRCTK
jgi:hypothetical protein